MKTDLHKRLEINAQFYANRVVPYGRSFREELKKESMDDFKAGAEYGYKEAIKMAKEWLNEKVYDGKYWSRDDEGGFLDADELLADFEADMNKLWEEKK